MSFVDDWRDRRTFDPERYRKVNLFATDLSMLDIYCLLPGQAQKVHAHAGNDKYYLVLEGRATITIGEDERVLGPGAAALARPGVVHGIRNDDESPLVAAVLQAPKPF